MPAPVTSTPAAPDSDAMPAEASTIAPTDDTETAPPLTMDTPPAESAECSSMPAALAVSETADAATIAATPPLYSESAPVPALMTATPVAPPRLPASIDDDDDDDRTLVGAVLGEDD
jgi:hypothetical protein